MVRHAGGFVGFRADMVRYPTEEFSVICLANLGSINPSGLCDEVADLYLADRFGDDASATMASDTVDGLVPVTLPLSALQSKAGTWLHEASGMQLETAVLEGRLELTAEVLGGAISLTPVGTARFVGDLDGQRLSATFAPDDATAQRATIAIRGVANLDLIRLPDLPAMSAAARGAYSGRYWRRRMAPRCRPACGDDAAPGARQVLGGVRDGGVSAPRRSGDGVPTQCRARPDPFHQAA